MPTPRNPNPLPSTGQYIPPRIVGAPGVPGDHPVQDLDAEHAYVAPTEVAHLVDILRRLYPKYGAAEVVGRFGTPGPVGSVIRNSQAIGDRPVTTMTNPLPSYSPLTMVKGQAAAQLRMLINHALAQRGLSPLINAPLPVGPTQMGVAR